MDSVFFYFLERNIIVFSFLSSKCYIILSKSLFLMYSRNAYSLFKQNKNNIINYYIYIYAIKVLLGCSDSFLNLKWFCVIALIAITKLKKNFSNNIYTAIMQHHTRNHKSFHTTIFKIALTMTVTQTWQVRHIISMLLIARTKSLDLKAAASMRKLRQ